MFKWIKGMFTHKKDLICGGIGECCVLDSLNREVGRIYYDRPTSQMKMDYIYDVENIANNKSRLKKIENDDKVSKQAYDMVINELCIPYAEKVFNRCSGYVDGDGNDISKLSKEKQFDFLKNYYSHNLVDMVVSAFTIENKLKKKS